MHYTQQGSTHVYTYTGLADFLDTAQRGVDRRHGQSQLKPSATWCPHTYDETVRMFRTGWTEGARAIHEQAAAIFARVTNKIPQLTTRWELTPDSAMLDMGRLNEGDPECWIELRDSDTYVENTGKRTVRVVVNLAASCGVDAEALFTRGAATLALVQALELAGRSVELVGVYGSRNLGSTVFMEHVVPLKAYGEQANPDVLACAVAHAGSLRRVKFAVMEGLPDELKRTFQVPGAYGWPHNTLVTRGDLEVPTTVGRSIWSSPEAAEQWVLDTLQAQGVTLLD